MSYKYFLNIALLFINLNIVSQINFEAKLSKSTLGVNERLRVEFSINEDGDNFSPPEFKNFKVVGGPSQSIKNSWVNGARSYSKSYTYFLSPIKMGTYNVGQAKIEVKGKVYKTLPIEIKVVSAVKNPNRENDPNYVSDSEIYLVSEISKSSPFLNEGFSSHYYLLTKKPIIFRSTIIIIIIQIICRAIQREIKVIVVNIFITNKIPRK